MTIGTWITQEEGKIASWFTDEEHALIQYFGPLFEQILAQAEVLVKDDAEAGLKVLIDAATAAVGAAATAKDKVGAAEAAFVKILTTEGVDAIHNAEAGLIKAAVAVIQTIGGTNATPPAQA